MSTQNINPESISSAKASQDEAVGNKGNAVAKR